MTKTKIETACEAVQKVGAPATVAQVSEALGLPLQATRDRLKNAKACGWLEATGGSPRFYVLTDAYLALEKTKARIAEIHKTGMLAGIRTNLERTATVIDALGAAGAWEVQIALATGASNASQYVSIALSRGWIALASDCGIRKYATTSAWRDHVAGAQEPCSKAPSGSVKKLEVEYVGMPKMRGPLAGTIWRACFGVAV